MAKDEMILMNMSFDSHHLDKVLMKLMDAKNFYPQKASSIVFNEEVGFLQEDRSYTDLLVRIKHIADDLKLELNEGEHDIKLDIKKVEVSLNGLEREIKKIMDISSQLQKEKHENELTLGMLKHLNSNDINFDQLNHCQYVTMRLGCIDKKNKDQFSYLDKYPVVFYELGKDNNLIWGCYVVVNSYLLEVDNFFKSIGFEEIDMPDFVHGEISDAKKELQNEVEAMQSYILNMDLKMDQLRIAHQDELMKIYATASYIAKKETYKDYVVDLKNKYSIYGFISKDNIKDLKNHFKGIDSLEYQILPSDTFEQQQIFAPNVVNNSKFIEPFELLSHKKQKIVYAYAYLYYGVFALFFGDLGVGSILALIGFLNKGKKSGRLLFALGVATILGGFVYGSVFYVINLYPAIIGFNILFRVIDGLVLIVSGTVGIRLLKDKWTMNQLSKKGIFTMIIIYIVLVYLLSLLENSIQLPFVPFAIVIGAILGLIVQLIRNKKRNKEGKNVWQ